MAEDQAADEAVVKEKRQTDAVRYHRLMVEDQAADEAADKEKR
jgi:hypothetical protein